MIQNIIKKYLNKETISYLIFGVLTTLVDMVIFQALLWLNIHYLIAQGIAWVGAVAFAFVTNKLFVFESKDTSRAVVIRELISFVGARVVSLVISTALLVVLVEWFSLSEMLAKLCTQVFVVIANYVFSKLFIFRKS
ncbi:MAG: GtrA family protein [Lachnospiraceae bacterium]|nr:GtrA family protein [Lachnospiraceae bacterium]